MSAARSEVSSERKPAVREGGAKADFVWLLPRCRDFNRPSIQLLLTA
jgi:hypothetical protein